MNPPDADAPPALLYGANRLVLAHFWAAFAAFLPAVALGAWQMWVRSPLGRLLHADLYYASVTAHGSTFGYVFPTLVAMGFGYACCVASLGQPLRGQRWAWAGFGLVVGGTVAVLAPVLAGRSSTLYTFYPPLAGSVFYYGGLLAVVVGSWVWVALMVVNLALWKREHPAQPVPLAMFATVAGALVWAWTSLGVSSEIVSVVLPYVFGWTPTVDAGLARVLFSWTLHGIVYFWLMPAYIAFYTLVPQAAGGRLYSDTMGRLTFILFLVFALPVGLHHLFGDPQIGTGLKFLHTVFTGMVAVPTLLTVFSMTASLEIGGRLRGGTGLFDWVARLPWDRPLVLAAGLSLVMLGLGGAGGLINMSYALNNSIHNTQWVTAHFHLIYAGAVVVVYFAVAYELWPRLTGRPLWSERLARWQIGSWFVGLLTLTVPWHVVGLMGQPRRMAFYDYGHPALAAQVPYMLASVVGGLVVLASAALVVVNLALSHRSFRAEVPVLPLRFALAVNPPHRLPAALNGFGFWNALLLVLMAVNYGIPIAQFALLKKRPVAPGFTVGGNRGPEGGAAR